jgi:hypothetical protein
MAGHFGKRALNKLHKPINGDTEDGACLTGHHSKYEDFKKKVSCNYRYQAYEQADSHAGIKSRLHGYEKRTEPVPTSAYKSKKRKMTPAWYTATLDAPDPDNLDWHLGGPKGPKKRSSFSRGTRKVKKGHNFTNAQWPYWNNAHHLIPKGTLKSTILEQPSEVANLIQQALLEAKYNVNHKVNMLLMPQDKEVAALLGLPRHIQLKEDDEPDLEAMCTDHPVYNEMVKTMRSGLSKIIGDYKEICDDAIKKAKDEGHKVPNAKLDKSRLERLSRTLLKMLLDAGAAGTGKAIDSTASAKMKKFGKK